jgi:hypothetical protein
MLLSLTSRKAKKISLNKDRNLILGKNSTGKSCLLKSIYRTFGAEPEVHPNWKKENILSCVTFSIEEDVYKIIKHRRHYYTFNKLGLLNISKSVTNELGPFLAKLFNFKLKHLDQSSELITPPPAYFLLPFYVDQDRSWDRNWDSFMNLRQLSKWKDSVVQYHTGIRPNQYYETKGILQQIREQKNVLEKELQLLKNILKNIKSKYKSNTFNIDIDTFKDEINELLVECEVLKKKQDELKEKLSIFYDYKITINSQIDITKNALLETQNDYKFTLIETRDETIECPTCGAEYENAFAERFSIAKDEARCYELLLELKNELIDVEEKIKKENEKFMENIVEINIIEDILKKKKGELKLKDVIEGEGRKEAENVFKYEKKRISGLLEENYLDIKKQEELLKKYADKKRKNEIIEYYLSLMESFLTKLDVHTLKKENYKNIHATIKESGSAKPRALIAYYYSILHVMNMYSSSVYCPIIIDSPNQQAQDRDNIRKILGFIRDNQPKDTQLILGLEDNMGIDFNCNTIELTEKYNLLQEREYEEVYAELMPYFHFVSNENDKLF